MAAPDADSEAPDVKELDKEEASEVPFVACADATLLLTAAEADTAVVAAEPVAFREEVGRVPV